MLTEIPTNAQRKEHENALVSFIENQIISNQSLFSKGVMLKCQI